MFLGTLGARLLGNLLTGTEAITTSEGCEANIFLDEVKLQLVTENFWNTKYHQNEPKVNGTYSTNNLPTIKDGVYVINLDEHISIEPHWIALYVNANTIVCSDSLKLNLFQTKSLEDS